VETKRYKILCERAVAEELVYELRKDEGATFSVNTSDKPLSGTLDVLSIIADLTSVGANLLALWLAARPKRKEQVKIQELDRKKKLPSKGTKEKRTKR
jgi:hypothetical protein